jgi:hypothetical protein
MRRKLELLAPEGSFGTFHLDIQTDYENSFHSAAGQSGDPILAELGISQVANDTALDASAVFVDLERGRVIRLPFAVSTLTRGMLPRRFLAVERAKPNDKLLFVDLDATKAVRLGTMPACPGPYWPRRHQDDEALARRRRCGRRLADRRNRPQRPGHRDQRRLVRHANEPPRREAGLKIGDD